ncbi:pyrimidine reductase family protein [Polymorphospora rubra]|uniref:pyrimidine reductase family protein n=1 Tax=Polymorphospora rubra TaxID=338584 RepID=UPI0033FA778F
MTAIRRLSPDPAGAGLDDDTIADLYGRPAAPTLRVNFVASADGAVEIEGHSAGLSGGPDKRVFGVLRMLCDALVVGAGTLRHEGYRALRLDDRRRAWRVAHGLPPYPTLVVVSGALDLDPRQAAFADAPVRPVILTHGRAPQRPDLAEVADLVTVGDDAVDLGAAVDLLRGRGHRQLLCEGGPQLFGGLTAADLVDEVCLTVSPLLAGAGAGRITAGPASPPRTMRLRHALAADDVLILRYTR